MKSEFERFCEKKRVRAEVLYTGESPPDESWKAEGWKVTLKYRGRQLTVPFYTGSAWTMEGREPTPADVLSCLCSDSSGYEGSQSFEEWASEYGYDTDSRKAEHIYRQVKEQSVKVRRLLGQDFDEFCERASDH